MHAVATTGQVGCGGLDLSCGDWIRIGNAELVIRYCGGGCKSKRRAGERARTAWLADQARQLLVF